MSTLTAGWGHTDPPEEAVLHAYQRAGAVPFVAHTSLEPVRWAARSVTPGSLGPLGRRERRRFTRALAQPVRVPVLTISGSSDPWLSPAVARDSERWVTGPVTRVVVPGGHYVTEQAPEPVTRALLDWLAGLD